PGSLDRWSVFGVHSTGQEPWLPAWLTLGVVLCIFIVDTGGRDEDTSSEVGQQPGPPPSEVRRRRGGSSGGRGRRTFPRRRCAGHPAPQAATAHPGPVVARRHGREPSRRVGDRTGGRQGGVVRRKGAYIPERGDAVWITLDPQAGHEQA